ncbi:hypothetical protein M0804_001964 [Polistes exclamans]|nr:hypothetical protein M0804_001964 [Polistes exclamans]
MSLTPLESKEGPLGSIQVVQLGAVPRFKCPGIPQMVPTKVTSRDYVFPLEGTLGVRAKKESVKRWRKDGIVKSPRLVSGANRNEKEETEGSLTTNFQRLSFSFIGHGLVFEVVM